MWHEGSSLLSHSQECLYNHRSLSISEVLRRYDILSMTLVYIEPSGRMGVSMRLAVLIARSVSPLLSARRLRLYKRYIDALSVLENIVHIDVWWCIAVLLSLDYTLRGITSQSGLSSRLSGGASLSHWVYWPRSIVSETSDKSQSIVLIDNLKPINKYYVFYIASWSMVILLFEYLYGSLGVYIIPSTTRTACAHRSLI